MREDCKYISKVKVNRLIVSGIFSFGHNPHYFPDEPSVYLLSKTEMLLQMGM